jgi:MoxR-like ATPase
MPSDITGTTVLRKDGNETLYKFIKGPIFANIILADEINRTPPKTQAALLQSMEERVVTNEGLDYKLEKPFNVFATQNPIEQEGTYPLPEAQLDRFMFNLWLGYPTVEEEIEIVKSTTSQYKAELKKVLTSEDILLYQNLIRTVPVADNVINYAVNIVNNTRPNSSTAPKFVKEWVSWGAGPRASQYLILAAKTKAVIDGRYTPNIDDVKFALVPTLRHRIIVNFNAEADGVTSVDVINRLIDEN